MVKVLFCFVLSLPLLADVFWPDVLRAAEAQTQVGRYSFVVPEGFEFRYFEDSALRYNKTLIINQPVSPKDFSQAIIYCLREKKNGVRSFTLPGKDRIYLQAAPRQNIHMAVSATEDVLQNGLRSRFNLLEERNTNTREIRDRENFLVVIEMNAQEEDFHTLFFVCDFRKSDKFSDFEEYKSKVTGVAIQLQDSIKAIQP